MNKQRKENILQSAFLNALLAECAADTLSSADASCCWEAGEKEQESTQGTMGRRTERRGLFLVDVCGEATNGTDHLGLVRPEYSGSAL